MSMVETEIIHGIIERVIFYNQENGFAVFVVKINATQQVTVKGSVAALTAGEQVSIKGVWNMHQKFGTLVANKNR